MKVAVINDCAFVFEDLLPFLEKKFDIVFIKRSRKFFDKTVGILLKIAKTKADLYHVNYALQDAYLASKLKRLDVLYCHGSDVRTTLHSWKYGWIVKSNLRSAGTVIYSLRDIEETVLKYRKDAVFVHRPVRTDLFTLKKMYNDPPKAVYFRKSYDNPPRILFEMLKKRGIEVTIPERFIPHNELPSFLSGFDILIDQTAYPIKSKLCLEAMSCGLAVITCSHLPLLTERIDMLKDVSYIKKEGQANRNFVLRHHDARTVAQKIAEIWRKAV